MTPWTAAFQAPPSMGFSRQEYWSGVPLPSLSLFIGEFKTQECEIKCEKGEPNSQQDSLLSGQPELFPAGTSWVGWPGSLSSCVGGTCSLEVAVFDKDVSKVYCLAFIL